jgi:hypothetical protein
MSNVELAVRRQPIGDYRTMAIFIGPLETEKAGYFANSGSARCFHGS